MSGQELFERTVVLVRDLSHAVFAIVVCVTGITVAFGLPIWLAITMLVMEGGVYLSWLMGAKPLKIAADGPLASFLKETAEGAKAAATSAKEAQTQMGEQIAQLTQRIDRCMQEYQLQQRVVFKQHGIHVPDDRGHQPQGIPVTSPHQPMGEPQDRPQSNRKQRRRGNRGGQNQGQPGQQA